MASYQRCICRICGNASAKMICRACSDQIRKELLAQARAAELKKRERNLNGAEEPRPGLTGIPHGRMVKAA